MKKGTETTTKVLEHRCGTISLSGDIYKMTVREGAEIELKDAIELIRLGTQITKGKRVGALVDSRANYTDSNEAREYFAKNTAQEQFVAVAVVTKELPQKLVINFYINYNRPNVPTKMFDNEPEALEWLREMMDGNPGE